MNLSKLFEMQKELDDYIVKTKGLEGQDLLPQKILALQVELAECANEHRGFKFWSENQKPRVKKEIKCECCEGTGIIDDESCLTYVGGIVGQENPLLEEYVDVLHFVLSIGNDLIHRKDINEIDRSKNSYSKQDNVTDQFNMLFSIYSELWNHGEIDDPYHDVICVFMDLGEMLGFTWEQIEQAYTDKWNINKQRQENGY